MLAMLVDDSSQLEAPGAILSQVVKCESDGEIFFKEPKNAFEISSGIIMKAFRSIFC